MIHPKTVVRSISEISGNGVFATSFIPKGTIMVVRDFFDFTFANEDFRQFPPVMQEAMETYMYRDKSGQLTLSWDHARYMNHHCQSNTLMTDYNLEIVVRDIEAGEEVTTDYGLLNVIEPYPISCGCEDCRGHLRLDDIDRFAGKWDVQVEESLKLIPSVDQPLLSVMQRKNRERLEGYLKGHSRYASVLELKWRP